MNVLELLISELTLFQPLHPTHPTDLIHTEWGFSGHGPHCNLWQKGPEQVETPLEFSSHSFSDSKMRCSNLEKGWSPCETGRTDKERIECCHEGTFPPPRCSS